MLQFYDVQHFLVRRWAPAQRRLTLEVWSGDVWAPYPDIDNVSRHGQRLSDAQALALLHEVRERLGPVARFSDEEADVALRSRLRRA